jgi:hypothetical protein
VLPALPLDRKTEAGPETWPPEGYRKDSWPS